MAGAGSSAAGVVGVRVTDEVAAGVFCFASWTASVMMIVHQGELVTMARPAAGFWHRAGPSGGRAAARWMWTMVRWEVLVERMIAG